MHQRSPGKSVVSRGHQALISARNGEKKKKAQLHDVRIKATALCSGKVDDRKESIKICCCWTCLHWMGWARCRQLAVFPAQPLHLQPQRLPKGTFGEQEDTQLVRAGGMFWNSQHCQGSIACTEELPTATSHALTYCQCHMQDRWTGRSAGAAEF